MGEKLSYIGLGDEFLKQTLKAQKNESKNEWDYNKLKTNKQTKNLCTSRKQSTK